MKNPEECSLMTRLVVVLIFSAIFALIWQQGVKQLDVKKSFTTEMNVSAYCKNECCCGRFSDGITASGVPAEGKIIAAPPNYLFGTVMDVPGYGRATVQDRGGVIKGNKLDLLFPTHQEALEWGRKTLKVKVYK